MIALHDNVTISPSADTTLGGATGVVEGFDKRTGRHRVFCQVRILAAPMWPIMEGKRLWFETTELSPPDVPYADTISDPPDVGRV